jgi:hypothetical protein
MYSFISQFPQGARAEVQALARAGLQSQAAGQRNHRAIVGAELCLREIQFRPFFMHDLREALPQAPVCADAAGHHEAPVSALAKGPTAFLREGLDHRLLKAARHVGARLIIEHSAAQGY